MNFLEHNIVRSCDRPQQRLEIVQLLYDKVYWFGDNEQVYWTKDNVKVYWSHDNVFITHRIAFLGINLDCIIPLLPHLKSPNPITDPFVLYNEDGKGHFVRKWWFDASHTTPIDYSMSNWDQFTNNCIRLGPPDLGNKYKFAEYLASLDDTIEKEFEYKKAIGTLVYSGQGVKGLD